MRLDHLESINGLESIRSSTNVPLIATNRRAGQGGLFQGSEDDGVETLLRARDAGFDYVDIELTTASIGNVAEDLRETGVKLIISLHDLDGTPPIKALNGILKKMLLIKPDICKIVGTARSYRDNLIYLGFLSENAKNRLVCFGMGREGIPSRVLSPLLGGAFTYASADGDAKSAPGQLAIGDLKKIYRLLEVD